MRRTRTTLRRPGGRRRRGVASILAMMFLVIFSSLAAVMGVVAHGNVRTAHSYMEVNRAMSAAQTGLNFGARRLHQAASRFVVEKGTIDDAFAEALWNGTWDADDGDVNILPPSDFLEDVPATSIATALVNSHQADAHNLVLAPGDELLPAVDDSGRVVVGPVAVTDEENSPTFRLVYEPLLDARFVRITAIGQDGELTRTIHADYQILKRLDAAIISPSRIMIGKNVHIDGPIGSRYGENPDDLDAEHGHPLVLRSDFRFLDEQLDQQIDALTESLSAYDVDGDNRLRPNHPSEAEGLDEPFLIDYNGDGFVDDYDLFMAFFDANGDGLLVYDADLAYGAGRGLLSVEFQGIDDQLAGLIDRGQPDRNGDGEVDEHDVTLGYLDGVIDDLDGYSKVNGRLMFKASKYEWETRQGDTPYQQFVQGPVRSGPEEPPIAFEVSDNELYDLTVANFTNSRTALQNAALAGLSFEQQVQAQLGHDPDSHVWTDSPTEPDYLRQELGAWEQMPIGSAGFYDWYQRAVYKNMTFVNVKIPMGNNGLFVNCTFIGAVYIETHSDNEHPAWNYLGMKEKVGNDYVDKFDPDAFEPPLEINGVPVTDTRLWSNNIRFHGCTFVGSIVSDPVTELTHVRNKIQFTGPTTFTLDADAILDSNLSPEQMDQAMQSFEELHGELEKSSLMAPNYSVDVGSFENDGQTVELKGTIVAGVMDVRGSADIEGSLLMTYQPVQDQGPLHFGGSVASFNTTIGYFGPEDGDGEGDEPSNETGFGDITIRYDPDRPLPDGILMPIRAAFVLGSYGEGDPS